MAAMEDEAHKVGLRIAHHAGVEETNAWDDIKFGTTSIEHWYGIPDAAIDERRAELSRRATTTTTRPTASATPATCGARPIPERLGKVLDGMVQAHVAWVPTLDIYEASRDLQRAQNQPWFAEYLHPTLEEYFRPNPANHGSYFLGWTSTDEMYWKENYRLWMAALREFDRRGGLIGMGDDAGFIYQMYGFGLIRSMELHQEAGFHPIKIMQQATGNNAQDPRAGGEAWARARRVRGRPDRGQRQSAGESEGALSDAASKRSATASRYTAAAWSGPSRTAFRITSDLMARVKEIARRRGRSAVQSTMLERGPVPLRTCTEGAGGGITGPRAVTAA